MRDRIFYVVYRAAIALISLFPLAALFRLGEAAGFVAWLILPGYRRLALHNVAIAFGREKSRAEMRELVRRHFQRLGANLLCTIKLGSMPPEQVEQRIHIENIVAMDREFRAGTPVALVLSHLGIWEFFAQLMPRFVGYVRNASVYQGLSNRLIDAHVKRTRSRTGLELFDRRDGFQPVIDLLRDGGGVGILSDQHAGDQGLWTPFFGRLASTSTLPALLAKRTGAAILAAAVYTDGPARWRMIFTERFDAPGASIEQLTAKANEIIALQIRRAPEDWFWVHNRWKTPQPNFLLGQYKRGVYLPPNMAAEQLKPFRILIRSSNWLGDAVMSIPTVRAIKRGRPDAHVTLLAPQNLTAVWKLVPEVDEVVPLADKSLISALRAIRERAAFDVAIVFPNSLRTALEVWLARIPRRVGYRGHSRSWFLNQIVRQPKKPRPPEHQSIHYLRIARELGAKIENAAMSAALFTASTKKVSPTDEPSSKSAKVALCPGAEYGPAKRWLPERFAEVAATVAAQQPVQWILFGTERDNVEGVQIAQVLGENCLNRIGQTTLEQLIDELRTCRLLLTNDTGTMHLATLLDLPTVAIFGSTEPRLTGPIGRNNIVLRHHVECSPCFLRICPIDFRCMKAVTVQEVADAVLAVLQNTSEVRSSESRTPKR